MQKLYIFLSLFASRLLLVTPRVIEKKQVENREEPPSLEVNKTTDPKTPVAPWIDVHFPLEEAENHDKNLPKSWHVRQLRGDWSF